MTTAWRFLIALLLTINAAASVTTLLFLLYLVREMPDYLQLWLGLIGQ